MSAFSESRWGGPFFAFAVFFYGGVPFLQMAVPELRQRQPGMMTLISVAPAAGVLPPYGILLSPAVGAPLISMSTVIVAANTQLLRNLDLGVEETAASARFHPVNFFSRMRLHLVAEEGKSAMDTGEKLLLFGGLPTDYLSEWEITSDLGVVAKKLGLRFEAVSTDELRSRYTSLSSQEQAEAACLAQDLIERASQGTQVADEEIVKAARLYLAMVRVVEERGGDGVTIVCKPWIRGEALPVPCVALTLFQERGIPAACQGDLDALLTMVLFNRVADVPTFMGGAVEIDGQLGISHCVLPRNLCTMEAEEQDYYLSDYHDRKESPTVHVGIPTGETATVARLTKGLRSLLLTSGTIRGCQDNKDRCRNTLVIDVPARERVFDAVKGVQNHYVVACGDHRAALEERAEKRGIKVVIL